MISTRSWPTWFRQLAVEFGERLDNSGVGPYFSTDPHANVWWDETRKMWMFETACDNRVEGTDAAKLRKRVERRCKTKGR